MDQTSNGMEAMDSREADFDVDAICEIIRVRVCTGLTRVCKLLRSLDDYMMHMGKNEDQNNLMSNRDMIKGVLLQQAVQAVVATILFVLFRNAESNAEVKALDVDAIFISHIQFNRA
ncbi:60S ribosomal protein L17 [Striga asiatica]|uniref:60S ribosomal protein L17 n=1 Tax=Striga asiatica TaxID=4170 RepID=A0A5A7QWZ5_STRAF|nr:60S ribosomal protein L17 [Striga asiatica]